MTLAIQGDNVQAELAYRDQHHNPLKAFAVLRNGNILVAADEAIDLVGWSEERGAYESKYSLDGFPNVIRMRVSRDEKHLIVCEYGYYLRDCKVSKIYIDDDSLALGAQYQSPRGLADIAIDEEADQVLVLDIIRGGPVDLTRSCITALDMSGQFSVVKKIENLQPSVNLIMSDKPGIVLYQESKTASLKIRDIINDVEVSNVDTQKVDQDVCVVRATSSLFVVGGHDGVTLIDKRYHQVVGRLKVCGTVKGICTDVNEKYLFILTMEELYRYCLDQDSYTECKELGQVKYFQQSPAEQDILYTATKDAKLNAVSLKGGFEVIKSYDCSQPVCRIAVNRDATFAYVVEGMADLYKFDLKKFERVGSRIAELAGACQSMVIATATGDQKEYLYVCGNRGVLKRFDAKSGTLLDDYDRAEADFIGMAHCKRLDCLIVGGQAGAVLFLNCHGFKQPQVINGKPYPSPAELIPLGGNIRSICVSEDQKYLAVGL